MRKRIEKYSKFLDRDTLIRKLYTEGGDDSTMEALANRFHLSKARIGRILNKVGIRKEHRPLPPLSDRTAYTGVTLHPDVKKALRKIAKSSDKKSLSAYIAGLIDEDLKRHNVVIERSLPNEIDTPLPLED